MTDYEVLDLISTFRAEGAQHVMNFVAVMFAYVVVAYFVGKSLTRAQVTLITTLYSIFLPGPLGATTEAMIAIRDLHFLYGDQVAVSTSTTGLIPIAYIIVPFALSLAWIISLIFMYQVRRS